MSSSYSLASRWIVWVEEKQLALPLAIFLFLRMWTLVWASLADMLLPSQLPLELYHQMLPLDGSAVAWLWSPWQRWDAIWYSLIAEHGYRAYDFSTAFFPLLPLLIRIVISISPLNSIASGMIISSIATLCTFLLFFYYVRVEFSERLARRALICLALFPTAFFLLAPYTESLFLLFALGALLAARSRRWGLAGCCGGLAALTRPQGVLLALPLAIEFVAQRSQNAVRWSRVLTLCGTLVGGLGFSIYLGIEFGDPLLWMRSQAHWHQFVLPWQALAQAIHVVVRAQDLVQLAYVILDPMMVLLFLGLAIWSLFRLGPTFATYMAIVILPPLFTITLDARVLPLSSFTRYALVAFPGMILMAQLPIPRHVDKWLATGALLLQTILLILFSQWIFVG